MPVNAVKRKMTADISRCSSFELIYHISDNDDCFMNKKSKESEYTAIDTMSNSPTLDFYSKCFNNIYELQSGALPVGVPRLAIYNSFLGTLSRGDVKTMLIKLTDNEPLKAVIKLRDCGSVFTIPFLDSEDTKRAIYAQPRTAKSYDHAFKGGEFASCFAVDELIFVSSRTDLMLPLTISAQLSQMSVKKVTAYGFNDVPLLRTFEKKAQSVTVHSLQSAPRMSSETFHYVDFTAQLLG